LIAYRPRDVSDILDVMFTQGKLDTQYMAEWIKKLHADEQWNEVLLRYQELNEQALWNYKGLEYIKLKCCFKQIT
jgi:hypothetical protein